MPIRQLANILVLLSFVHASDFSSRLSLSLPPPSVCVHSVPEDSSLQHKHGRLYQSPSGGSRQQLINTQTASPCLVSPSARHWQNKFVIISRQYYASVFTVSGRDTGKQIVAEGVFFLFPLCFFFFIPLQRDLLCVCV